MHKHHCGECDHTLNNFLNKAVKTGPVYSPLRASCKGSAIALAGDIRSLSFNQRLFLGGGGGGAVEVTSLAVLKMSFMLTWVI